MYQIASAMQYLSSMQLVHRDLAARNVLLASEDIAKVSDFGMSRKMNENSYYYTKTQGKWPLKWYPPETVFKNNKKNLTSYYFL
jgi:serine/threonine protein kinase